MFFLEYPRFTEGSSLSENAQESWGGLVDFFENALETRRALVFFLRMPKNHGRP